MGRFLAALIRCAGLPLRADATARAAGRGPSSRMPFEGLPTLPSIYSIASMLGGPPKEAACDDFGRGPGLIGLVGDAIGLPPEWTDKGVPANMQSARDASLRPASDTQ